MKNWNKALLLAGCLASLTIGGGSVLAQGRGNFDPQAMMERRLEGFREQMDVKDDTEWNAISDKIKAVMEAERDVMSNRMRGMFRPRRNQDDNGGGNGGNGDQQRRRGGFGTPSPAFEDLQKAIDDKAAAADVKAKLAAFRADTAAKQAKLDKAQDDLKSVLTSRREAVAVLGGLLK